MVGIPTSIDDVTPAWLAEVTGLPVATVEAEQIGMGIGVSSAVYRLRARGRRLPRDGGREAARRSTRRPCSPRLC